MAVKRLPLLQRLHAEIDRMFWAGLIAVLMFFAVFTLPYIQENQAAYRAARQAEISAENDFYCRRWNLVPGTSLYRSCLDDLQALRSSIEKKLSEEYEF